MTQRKMGDGLALMKLAENRVYDFVQREYITDAESYIDYRTRGNAPHPENLLPPLVRSALQSANSHILDILDFGCGYGAALHPDLVFNSYVGVDISKRLLENHVLRDHPSATLTDADIRTWRPNADVRYNVFLSVLALHYIKEPKSIITELRKPYIHFCICLPNPEFDEEYGSISNDGIVSLRFNNKDFIYYHHQMGAFLDTLKPFCELHLLYSPMYFGHKHPPYYIAYGQWQ